MPRSWAVTAIAARATIVSDARERRAERAARGQRDERAAVKPISRILFASARPCGLASAQRPFLSPGHYWSGPATYPETVGRAALKRLPIWSCSVRGFACHFCYQKRGALLPHLFTLTRLRPRPPRVSGDGAPGSVGLTLETPSRACRAEAQGAEGAESEGGRYLFCATGPSGCPARVLPGALSWWSSDFPLPAPVPRAQGSLPNPARKA